MNVLVQPRPIVQRAVAGLVEGQEESKQAVLTPAEHDSREIDRRFDETFLHEHVAGDGEDDVRNVQDPKRHVVIVGLHLQISGHALDLGIGDVGTINEGNNEEPNERREELEVALPVQSPLHGLIDDKGTVMHLGGSGIVLVAFLAI